MEISKSHRAYFEAAKSVSKLSDYKRVKMGAVAVYNHRIISSASNSDKSDPLQKKFNVVRFEEDGKHSAHAEIRCLKPLIGDKSIDFSRVSLYVYRELKNGKIALARPCKSCEKLIRELGIKKIFYTGNESFVAENFI